MSTVQRWSEHCAGRSLKASKYQTFFMDPVLLWFFNPAMVTAVTSLDSSYELLQKTKACIWCQCCALMFASPTPSSAWLSVLCMLVSVVAVVQSPLKWLNPTFFSLSSSDAPHGTSLFLLLSLRILSPLHKTVGRNKGTAFSFSYFMLLWPAGAAWSSIIRCGHKLVCVFGRECEICIPANKQSVSRRREE